MLERLGINAKEAEKTLMVASSEKKNQALKNIAEGLIENTDKIILSSKDREVCVNCLNSLNSHSGAMKLIRPTDIFGDAIASYN